MGDSLRQIALENIENFWKVSDRKRRLDPLNVNISNVHNWGVANKLPEKSATLQGLINNKTVIYEMKLPEGNYTVMFRKVMEELQMDYKTVELPLIKSGESIVSIETKTVPAWAFEGEGYRTPQAIEAASKKGIKFLITVSSDYVLL